MAKIPAHNPSIPYLGAIPGGLRHGVMLRIKGQMHSYADRFDVNLQCGPALNPLDNVALHLSIRPAENAIVRNDHLAGWGDEERHGGCPINPGQFYEILILAEQSKYKIAVNGNHFCEFVHRQPLSEVRFVHITGQTSVNLINPEGDTSQTMHSVINATAPPIPAVCPPANFPRMPQVPGYVPPPSYAPPNFSTSSPAQQRPYNPSAALSYGAQPYPVQPPVMMEQHFYPNNPSNLNTQYQAHPSAGQPPRW